jgi:Fibrinogen beta and gamma chains, C-terminal globular domain
LEYGVNAGQAANYLVPPPLVSKLTLSVFGWIVIMQRAGFIYQWGLNMNNYTNGFGSFNQSDFWLGLDTVNQLTTVAPRRLRIEMQQAGDGAWYSAEYWKFSIGNRNAMYQLSVSG